MLPNLAHDDISRVLAGDNVSFGKIKFVDTQSKINRLGFAPLNRKSNSNVSNKRGADAIHLFHRTESIVSVDVGIRTYCGSFKNNSGKRDSFIGEGIEHLA